MTSKLPLFSGIINAVLIANSPLQNKIVKNYQLYDEEQLVNIFLKTLNVRCLFTQPKASNV